MTNPPLLRPTDRGLACRAGGFVIDPDTPVDVAVFTHAHADHARAGHGVAYCSAASEGVLRHRLGPEQRLVPLAWGEPVVLGEVSISLHPAGHVLGSAQVRVEGPDGTVWVVSGDHKRAPDPTVTPFEVVPCDVFVTEATFGLPIFRWPDPDSVIDQVLDWWAQARRDGHPVLLGAYAFGKAQRLLAGITQRGTADLPPVVVHGAVEALAPCYAAAGVPQHPIVHVGALEEEAERRVGWSGRLILAPPGQLRAPWSRRFKGVRRGFASGWMRVRGHRRRRSVDRGFVLSDHADFDALVRTATETGASRVYTHHGYAEPLARHLDEVVGLPAAPLATLSEEG